MPDGTDDRCAIVARDFVSAWWLLATAGGHELHDADGLRWYHSGAADWYTNAVVGTRLAAADADAAIDRLLAELRPPDAGASACGHDPVSAGPTAELFQLARLLDDQVSAVVAVVDTNTCRLFVTRRGGIAERSGPDEGTAEHTRHDTGGWSERAVSFLDPELPEAVRPLVEHIARIDIRASAEDVRDEIRPLLAALEEADGQAAAERAVAGWQAGDLGVVATLRWRTGWRNS